MMVHVVMMATAVKCLFWTAGFFHFGNTVSQCLMSWKADWRSSAKLTNEAGLAVVGSRTRVGGIALEGELPGGGLLLGPVSPPAGRAARSRRLQCRARSCSAAKTLNTGIAWRWYSPGRGCLGLNAVG